MSSISEGKQNWVPSDSCDDGLTWTSRAATNDDSVPAFAKMVVDTLIRDFSIVEQNNAILLIKISVRDLRDDKLRECSRRIQFLEESMVSLGSAGSSKLTPEIEFSSKEDSFIDGIDDFHDSIKNLAKDVVDNILTSFKLEEQNEVIESIHNLIFEIRQGEIGILNKQCDSIRHSVENIPYLK